MVRNNNVQNQDQGLDPYFVHPSESLSTVSVKSQLSGDNYHAWSMKIRRALAIAGYLDGSIPISEKYDLNCATWERCK